MKSARISRSFGLLQSSLLALVAVTVIALVPSDVLAQDKTVSFETDIKPIFEKHCIRCHGPEKQDEGFRIDDRDVMLDEYIDAGDPDFSRIYDEHIVTEDEEQMMPPPNEGGPLPDSQKDLIRNWILQGAEWPEEVKLELIKEVVEEVKEEIAKEEKAKDATQDNFKLATEVTGLLHPLVLHFPVALLMGGALFALFGFRGESPLSDAAYYCLWLGALTAIFACLSGWYFAIDKNMTEWQRLDFNESIDVHRWGGIVVAAIAFMLALIAASSRRRDPYGTGAFWKLGMILLACLTGYVAHHGGKMTHDGLHEKLFNKTNQLYENISGNTKAPADDANQANEGDEKADEEGTGEKSDEASGEASDESEDKKADEGKKKAVSD